MSTPRETAPITPQLDKIAAGEGLDGSDAICWALREIMPLAEPWAGRNIELVCDQHGWSVRCTGDSNYRDRLLVRYGHRFNCAEDAIQAIVNLCAENKAEHEREEAAQ